MHNTYNNMRIHDRLKYKKTRTEKKSRGYLRH